VKIGGIMRKGILTSLVLIFILTVSSVFATDAVSTATPYQVEKNIEFTDDVGRTIKVEKPAKKIISLYSAHTENLFYLGLADEIIGVGTSDAYPVDVLNKKVFSYKSDPEKIIVEEPDLVLLRPFIDRSKPEFVQALENAGIQVVSLYPESFDKFDDYIIKLGKLTGRTYTAKMKLKEFHEELDKIKLTTSKIENKKKVYFESTEADLRTITPDSMPGRAIVMAGAINVASDAVAMRAGTSIASYGAERILEKADEIDVFISQRGAMNAGGNEHSISIRPGFDNIKAVKDGNIFVINEKHASSPTFRYVKGVKEIARYCYPEMMDSLESFNSNEALNRAVLADMAVKYTHRQIFSPSSKYYRSKGRGHVYGEFTDVTYKDLDYEYIESAVMAGLVKYDGKLFNRNVKITRYDLAQTLYLFEDVKRDGREVDIKDIDKYQKSNIVKAMVVNGIMNLDKDGNFNGDLVVTVNEAREIMERMKSIY
jgi:iron complex transport system substrate-binding protein